MKIVGGLYLCVISGLYRLSVSIKNEWSQISNAGKYTPNVNIDQW